jgi:hypothetical protein
VPASARDTRSSAGRAGHLIRAQVSAARLSGKPPQDGFVQARLRHFQIHASDEHRSGRRADARADRVSRPRRSYRHPVDRTASQQRSGRPCGLDSAAGIRRFSPFGAVVSMATSRWPPA